MIEDVEFYKRLLKYWEYENKGQDCAGNPIKIVESSYGDIACVYWGDNEIVITCPGSDNEKEWRGNLDAYIPIGGFHNNYNKVANEIFVKLYDTIFDMRKAHCLPIKIVCHSRGGYGQILEYLLRKAEFGGIETITFGSPKVATLSGHKKLTKSMCNHTRVTCAHDPVPLLPPAFMPLPYPTIWKHYETTLVALPQVKGEFDHLHYGEALKAKIEELENGE